MPHFSLAPASSPHVSACPICAKSLPLMSQPAPFAPSHFSSCPGLPEVSSPHVPAYSLCQTPCFIVSLSCISEEKFVFCQAWWYVCRHWQRGLFYSLVLWRDCVGDFEWHSSFLAVVFTFEWLSLREKQRFVWGSPRCGQSRVHCFWMKVKVWFHPARIACPFSYTKSVHGCLMLLECFLARLHS